MSDTVQTPQPAASAPSAQAGQAADAAKPADGGTKAPRPLATPEPQAGSCCGSGGCH